MTTGPKEQNPVKPLVAFAAVRDGTIWAWTVQLSAKHVRDTVGNEYSGGWAEAKRYGYRVIKVRIEPVGE